MSYHDGLTRRGFVKRAATAVAVPAFIMPSTLGYGGTVRPSDRITLGLIGCGHHGTGWNLDQIFRNDDSQVVAVCDVDEPRMLTAQAKVDAHYAQKRGKNYQGCAMHGDFRDLINRPDIDAVAICTPDHWHVIPAMMAAKAGKDVICEKPLSLTVEEGRLLCDTLYHTRRVFQTASENRSIETYIRICELVRNGRIGDITHIQVMLPGGNDKRSGQFDQRETTSIPKGFNYEMWQGQTPLAPYAPARCHGSFRWNLAYSGGRLTDWGAHLIDLAQWGNSTETSGPVAVRGVGKFPPRDALFNTAPEFSVDYRYANGVTMNVATGTAGLRFEGTEGWIAFEKWRGPLIASNPAILESKIGPNEVHLHRPRVVIARRDSKGGEHRNFLDCVKSRRPCYAPAEIGHRTISVAHIGNISMLLGRELKWDPEIERFVGDAEANTMLRREQREPWAIKNIDSWINRHA